MKKYEYYVFETADQFFTPIDVEALQDELDELGREGWELVSMTDRGAKWWSRRARRLMITLKREVTAETQAIG